MRTWECPACGYGYVHRAGRRCRRCGVHLLMAGEAYFADGTAAYCWTSTGWAELLTGKHAPLGLSRGSADSGQVGSA